ncbi:MAG: threonine synthase [Vicinamibacterales bacterium]
MSPVKSDSFSPAPSRQSPIRKSPSALLGLQCHLCKAQFPAEASYVCGKCLGPLEPVYDYRAIKVTREEIEQRPKNLWRYLELLPIMGEPLTGFHSGFTPLVRCSRLADRLGLSELYIKDDTVNHPTLSYKDRVVSVAATRAVELGFKVLACASTGNLANSVAAHAARMGMECCVLIPDNLEPGKVLGSAIYRPTILAIAGNYDDVNRLSTQVADRHGWGFVNINLRSYYAEGAKTLGFEIAEQLGWRYPRHIVSPVAGGTLLPRIHRGLRELREIGLVEGELPHIHAAQAAGSAPVVRALEAGLDHPEPVRPDTIAKSIAIGNPADGFQVIESVRSTGGTGAAVTDTQIIDAIQLLAETEGIFAEPAGGTTLAATIELVRRGVIKSGESVVVCVTGNGYKTMDVLDGRLTPPVRLGRGFKEFEAWWESTRGAGARSSSSTQPVA